MMRAFIVLACKLMLAGCAGLPPKREPMNDAYWRSVADYLRQDVYNRPPVTDTNHDARP